MKHSRINKKLMSIKKKKTNRTNLQQKYVWLNTACDLTAGDRVDNCGLLNLQVVSLDPCSDRVYLKGIKKRNP